jgi:hypothetical protein
MVGSVVVVAFQIVFRIKIHINNIFYFLKIIFNISTSKRFKKIQITFNFNKKNFNI